MFTVVIEVEMKLGFEQAVILLGLCVIAAGFLYFCCAINLNRGFGKDHPEERLPDNHRQQRNKRRGRGRQIRGTDRPRSESFPANSSLRRRPRPQENDEPL